MTPPHAHRLSSLYLGLRSRLARAAPLVGSSGSVEEERQRERESERGAVESLNPGAHIVGGRTNLRPLSLMGKERRAFRGLAVTRFDEPLSSACRKRANSSNQRTNERRERVDRGAGAPRPDPSFRLHEKRVSLTFPTSARPPQPLHTPARRQKPSPGSETGSLNGRTSSTRDVSHGRGAEGCGYQPRLVSLAANISSPYRRTRGGWLAVALSPLRSLISKR